MNHEQATAAVKIVTQETIKFLAQKHCVTGAEIVEGLLAGNQNLVKQWRQLFAAAQAAI